MKHPALALAVFCLTAGLFAQIVPAHRRQAARVPAVSGEEADTVVFPLKVSSNGRYLTDQEDDPFLIAGRSGWSMIVQCTTNEVETYLDDCAAKGYNSTICFLTSDTVSDDPPNNIYGVAPYSTPGTFASANDTYFAWVQHCFNEAAERGIVVFAAPIYLNWWDVEVAATTDADMEDYGNYIATKFGSQSNVVWIIGGDHNPDATELQRINAFVTGLTNVTQPLTAYSAVGQSAFDQYGAQSWLELNSVATYNMDGLVENEFWVEYNRAGPLPVFYLEPRFENEGGAPAQMLRMQSYASVLAGGCGFYKGNFPIWRFDLTGDGWEDNLDDPGELLNTNAIYFFANTLTNKWHLLVPDQLELMVTGAATSGSNQVATARASDGSLIVSYVPTNSPVTINLTWLNNTNANVSWYNPRSNLWYYYDDVYTVGVTAWATNSPYTSDTEDWLLKIDETANIATVGTTTISLVSTGTVAASSGANVSPGWPAGMSANDVAVCVWHNSSEFDGTMTGDWTLIGNWDGGGTASHLAAWWHRYDGVTPPSTTVSCTDVAYTKIAQIAAFSGVETTGNPTTVGTHWGQSTGTNFVHLGVVSPNDSSLILLMCGAGDNNAWTVPAGITPVIVQLSSLGTPDGMLSMGTRATQTGLTGNILTYNAATENWTAVQVVLKAE